MINILLLPNDPEKAKNIAITNRAQISEIVCLVQNSAVTHIRARGNSEIY